MVRLVFPLALGVLGVGILVALGVWQLQRLDWKEGLLAEIEDRIADTPVALPERPTAEADAYRAVAFEGMIGRDFVPVFGTWREAGAGYRIIVPVDTGDRRILVDLGVASRAAPELPTNMLTFQGNLNWPDETEATPEAEIWTNLDVPALAARLGTEPVLVVARTITGAPLAFTPVPIGTEGIPNNHLGYAIQWFALALVWAGMTAFLVRRMHSPTGD